VGLRLAAVSSRPDRSESDSLTAFFAATHTVSWILWVPMALSSQGFLSIQISPILGIMLGGMSPSLVAIVLTAVEGGRNGLRDLLGRLLRWRVAVQWYALVLFAPAVLMVCALVINAVLEATTLRLPTVGNWAAVLALFVFTLLFGGPLGEEIGWRGYALPRLQSRQSSLVASVVLGAVWGLWHLPLFWIEGSLQAGIPATWFVASIVAESIVYTWVYNHTRGSLLPVCLFHAAINTWAKLILLPALAAGLRPLLLAFGAEVVLAVIIVAVERPSFVSRKEAHE
jgi:membrane protease YdiL (CAAX protease family)